MAARASNAKLAVFISSLLSFFSFLCKRLEERQGLRPFFLFFSFLFSLSFSLSLSRFSLAG